ncbi:glycosyl transferase family 2 [Flavobacterium suaedae]|uniref:Glycosyl transferase family 2 n=1 Tax=Flavobacterium suaedae TaxID=1767027 RepID=A0ABQ1K2M7_9FLAO|nr:glycosyltransferase family 2 protein [Flavobacterium suaedae]GGB86144.1 glycosyl transferase family 2 [Flavobacterium suaedae]
MQKLPSSTLLITTYNWPEALELILMSLLKQTKMPDEVIIADDGSGKETKELIDKYKEKLSIPLLHIWHEDKGFRKSIIINKAIAQSKSDYIIEIDGDIIMEKHFIEDHLRFAEEGMYLFGSRATITKEKLPELFKKKLIHFNFSSSGIKKRGRTLRIPLFMNFIKPVALRSKKLRGCNMSFWKKDFLAINGYNENIVGWGMDDSELIERMHNNGVLGKRLKYTGLAYHIYHKEQPKNNLEINKKIEKETTAKKITYVDKGIDQYLKK